MKFKFFGSLFLAILAGFFIAQTFLFIGQNGYKIASNTLLDIQNKNITLSELINLSELQSSIYDNLNKLSRNIYSGIDNLASTISFSRTIKINDLNSQNIYSDISEVVSNQLAYENSIFVNPATAVFEDFPTNSPDSINQHKFSEDLTIPDEGRVVVANLETMELDLFVDGEIVQNMKILSKGRPGTPWETPPGSFQIMHMTENHFSSIGEVWLPYSMQFFGNYFIHGWPHHSDGTPVPQGYSGGCIRLSDEDARRVFDFVSIGTRVVVLGTTAESISSIQKGYYVINNTESFPEISAHSYLVADLESGNVLFSRNSDKAYSIASITKLMTALVSLETINQYLYATVSQRAYDTEGWRGNLSVGERILTGDLIYPLLLQSSNDASEVLAEFSGRNNFIRNMNRRAESLNLNSTFFDDPSGLSPLNISTASDLFKLTHYIYRYKRFVFDVTRMETYRNERHDWPNTHRFSGSEIFLGGKNGFTDEARHTLITLVSLDLISNRLSSDNHIGIINSDQLESDMTNRKFAIILLQAEGTADDTQKIIDFIRNNVEYRY